jgi:hypothetical protein
LVERWQGGLDGPSELAPEGQGVVSDPLERFSYGVVAVDGCEALELLGCLRDLAVCVPALGHPKLGLDDVRYTPRKVFFGRHFGCGLLAAPSQRANRPPLNVGIGPL